MEINRWPSKENDALAGMSKYARPVESSSTSRLKFEAKPNVGDDQQLALSLTEILGGIG
jgi:hypothetical protein